MVAYSTVPSKSTEFTGPISGVQPVIVGQLFHDSASNKLYTASSLTLGDLTERGGGTGTSLTDAQIKTQYENNADTNAFTDAAVAYLAGIEAGADVTDSANVVLALDSATLTSVTGENTDEVLIKDSSDSNNLKTVSLQDLLGGSALTIENNGSPLSTAATKLNFTNFTITEPVANEFTITAPIGSGGSTNSLLTDLIGYWEFNNSLDSYDTTIPFTGTPTYTPGIINQAVAGDSVLSNSEASLATGTSSFSYSVWVYLPSTGMPTGGTLLCGFPPDAWGTFTGTSSLYFRDYTDPDFIFRVDGQQIDTTATANLDAWNHVVITYDGTDFVLYVNNVAESFTSTSSFTIDGAISSGFQVCNSASNGFFTPSPTTLTDNLGVWSRALSAAEVSDLYNSFTSLEISGLSSGTSGATIISLTSDAASITTPVALDKNYTILIEGGTTTNTGINLFADTDLVASNYNSQQYFLTGNADSKSRINLPRIAETGGVGQRIFGKVEVSTRGNRFFFISDTTRENASSLPELQTFAGNKTAALTAISNLVISPTSGDLASGFTITIFETGS